DVDDDHVTGLEGGDRPAVGRLGRDVADHEAVRGAGKAAVGHERDLVAEAGALDRTRDMQHLAHAGTALGSFPADDDDVVRLDLARLHRGEAVLLAVEDARRPAVHVLLLPGHLRHAAVGREVAAQDDEAALGLDRIAQRADDLLPRRLARGARFLADRAAGHGLLGAGLQPGAGPSLNSIVETPRIPDAVVLCVPVTCPLQAPSPGHDAHSTSCSSLSSILPALRAPIASKMSCTVIRLPLYSPYMIEPP